MCSTSSRPYSQCSSNQTMLSIKSNYDLNSWPVQSVGTLCTILMNVRNRPAIIFFSEVHSWSPQSASVIQESQGVNQFAKHHALLCTSIDTYWARFNFQFIIKSIHTSACTKSSKTTSSGGRWNSCRYSALFTDFCVCKIWTKSTSHKHYFVPK